MDLSQTAAHVPEIHNRSGKKLNRQSLWVSTTTSPLLCHPTVLIWNYRGGESDTLKDTVTEKSPRSDVTSILNTVDDSIQPGSNTCFVVCLPSIVTVSKPPGISMSSDVYHAINQAARLCKTTTGNTLNVHRIKIWVRSGSMEAD